MKVFVTVGEVMDGRLWGELTDGRNHGVLVMNGSSLSDVVYGISQS